jgi:hypothetical protein
MGTQIEYSQEKELDEALDKLLHSFPCFTPLLDNVKVAACFCVRTDDNEATVAGKTPVVIKKVPADMQVFMKPKATFILVVDYHFWENADERQKNGHMHKALSRVKVEKTEAGLKISMRKWDIQENFTTLKDIGAYDEGHVVLVEMVRSKQLSMMQAIVERKVTGKPEPTPEPEPEEPDPEEKPRVRAGPMPPKKGEAKNEDEEPRRPARRIPPDPPKSKPADEEEPEPED